MGGNIFIKRYLKNYEPTTQHNTTQHNTTQAWDFYFLTNTLDSFQIDTITNLNNNVVQKNNAAAFLVQYCWEWYDGKCDKKHRICPEDIQVQFNNFGLNNCANPTFNNTGEDFPSGVIVSNLSSLPLPPSLCCESNCSNFLNASQSKTPGVPLNPYLLASLGMQLVGAPALQGGCVSFPLKNAILLPSPNLPLQVNQAVFPPNSGISIGTILLQVCLNTKSDCLFVKTPTTQNQYSRFTCTSSTGEKKCIYSIGSQGGRCTSQSVSGQPKSSNGSITLIKPDYTPLSASNCNDETTYTYFSGALAGTQGTIISQCNDGSPNNCGQPQALGLFGNCQLTISQVCPCYRELGYNGKADDLVFTTTEADSDITRGLSFPYTYMCLTWREKNGGCCPITKSWY